MCTRAIHFAMLCTCLTACRVYSDSTPRAYLESDHAGNYHRIFGSEPPAQVRIVNSVVINYSWRPGVVTTDDWEFELLAPRSWIGGTMEHFHLAKSRPTTTLSLVGERKDHPIRAWYGPDPIESYEAYASYATSIPYIHMLVSRQPENDARHRVFVSKH